MTTEGRGCYSKAMTKLLRRCDPNSKRGGKNN